MYGVTISGWVLRWWTESFIMCMVEGQGSGARQSASCLEMEGGGNQLSGTHSIPVEVAYTKWNSAQGGTGFSSSSSTVLVTTPKVRMMAPFYNLCYHLTEVYYHLYSDDGRCQICQSFLTALWLDNILYRVDGFRTPRKPSLHLPVPSFTPLASSSASIWTRLREKCPMWREKFICHEDY